MSEPAEIKTTAMILDEFVTASIKCYMAQEDMRYAESDDEFAEAARMAQTENARRNRLLRAIERRLDGTQTIPTKTYG